MFSEHLIANLLPFVQERYPTGADLDAATGRPVVQVGRMIGVDVGAEPSDAFLAWWAAKVGSPAAVGDRATIHILPGNRVGVGLGAGRGVIESTGDHLGIVLTPEPGRYTGAYRLPTIEYGGLV